MKPRDCNKFKPICCCEGFAEQGIIYCTGEKDGIQCADFEDCLMCHWYGIKGCEYERRKDER